MQLNWFRRKQYEEELDAEIRSHLDQAIRDRLARGETPEEARANALREFGNVGLVKEVTRAMWGWGWLEQLGQDLQFGLRMLRKNPGFSLVAILTLALGVGANTAIFSVVNAVLLNPFAYPEAERIMFLSSSRLSEPDSSNAISYPNFLDWQKQQTAFLHLAAARNRTFNLSGVAEPVQVSGAIISPEAFPLLGVAPQLGRIFSEQDNQLYAARTVVLSHAFWQKQFAGEANVVGRQLLLDDQAYTVIGVMPPRFKFWAGEVWVPFGLFGNEDFATRRAGIVMIFAVGRLKPGVTQEQARAEFNVIAARLAAQYPEANQGSGVRIVSWSESFGRKIRPTLLMLMGAVAFVLLIACANVASLLLARIAESLKPQRFNTLLMSLFAALALTLAVIGLYGVLAYTVVQRTHEIGIRLALGAQTHDVLWLIVRQGLALTLVGVALGLGGAFALTRVLQNLLYGVSATDPATFAGIALLLICVACLASFIPARRAAKVDPLVALRHE
jgi:putative ABC transport system permease protein